MTEPVGAGGRGRAVAGGRVGVSGITMRVAVGGGFVAVGGSGVKVRDAVGTAVAGRVGVFDGTGVGGTGVGVGVGGAPHAMATLAKTASVSKRKIIRLFMGISF